VKDGHQDKEQGNECLLSGTVEIKGKTMTHTASTSEPHDMSDCLITKDN